MLDGLKTFDSAVLRVKGKNGEPDRTQEVAAGLFEMTVDGGGKLKTYCIDLHNPTQDQAKYLETPWAETSLNSNRDAGRIRWILQHSYPQVDDLAALAKAAGTGPLTDRTAAAPRSPSGATRTAPTSPPGTSRPRSSPTGCTAAPAR